MGIVYHYSASAWLKKSYLPQFSTDLMQHPMSTLSDINQTHPRCSVTNRRSLNLAKSSSGDFYICHIAYELTSL